MMSPFPAFYDPQRVGTLFYPDLNAVARAATAAQLPPAARDSSNVQLLLIDMQVDFCHEQGALYVPGAEDDIRRIVNFIFRHAAAISGITATLDSHLPFQIFHPPWWIDRDGNHPAPLTLIAAADVAAGQWRPVVLPEFSRRYVEALEQQARKMLTIWPYHVLIGGPGNTLDPALFEVVQWHGLARKSQPAWVVKGRLPQSEHYSAVQPEIDVPGHPLGRRNQALLDSIAAADRVFIAGEAESHCVLATLNDIVGHFADRPEVLARLTVLQDCMSPVQHPAVDFHALAQEQFARFADQGVHFVDSTAVDLTPAGGGVDAAAPVRALDPYGA
jgi:nicotinamidase-related amidase